MLLQLPALAWGLELYVGTPAADHIARHAAQHLAARLGADATLLPVGASPAPSASPRLHVLPINDLARTVPELAVLQLPFFYPDLEAIHRALDGALGARLQRAARDRGWEIFAFWDEGMEVFSGNQAYIQPRLLQGLEFLLLRDDPTAEIALRALDVWTRRARPASLAQLHKECVVASRAATMQQILSEQLPRVHLDLTLTRHRYEGWGVAMPREDFNRLSEAQRARLRAELDAMRVWQRQEAAAREAAARAELTRLAMTAHALPEATWHTYRAMQPAWERFFSDRLGAKSRAALIRTAARAAGFDSARESAAPLQQRAP